MVKETMLPKQNSSQPRRAGTGSCRDLFLNLALGDVTEVSHGHILGMSEHLLNVAGEDRMYCTNGCGLASTEGGLRVVKSGVCCGALMAAVAVLYCIKHHDDAVECQDRLMNWFYSAFGSYDCEGVMSRADAPRDILCPRLILATYLQFRTHLGDCEHLAKKSLGLI
jgi:hypothetical protein